jgi:hypothetical protein
MDNLLDLLKGQITPELVEKASGLVGETPANTGKALGVLGPVLLSTLANKGSSKSGAEQILSTLSDNKVDDGLLGNVMGMLGGGNSSSLLSMGGPIVSMLLGNKAGGVVEMISSLVGIKSNSITTLMSLAAPLIGGLLSKQVKTGGLDASGLASMLGSQKSVLAAAAPKGLDALLGFGDGVSNAASKVTSAAQGAVGAGTNMARSTVNTATSTANTATAGGSSMMKWLLPLLAVLLLGFLAWRLLGGSGPDLKLAACAPLTALEQKVSTGMPTITADTKVSDVKAWMATIKTGLDTLTTAGKAAGVDTSGITGAYTALETAINAVTGDTLGTASEGINTAISGFKKVQTDFKGVVGCK